MDEHAHCVKSLRWFLYREAEEIFRSQILPYGWVARLPQDHPQVLQSAVSRFLIG